MTESKAWIAGCAGQRLTADEKAFFADERPWGFILFGRNVAEASQLGDLVAELKAIASRPNPPIFVDQEGGRVQRLRPPLAPLYPPGGVLGRLYAADAEAGERAAWLQGRLIAADLQRYGINADCLPCLDVPAVGSHSVIGERAYAGDPAVVARLGRLAAEGLMAGGVLPVMKHLPGHGRGNADSHLEMPVVEAPLCELEKTDFAPFTALRDLPCAMTAHLLFTAIDPDKPATLSKKVIGDVIRGRIGFDGLLMTDDMSMKALRGELGDLAGQALAAGCDMVLHCNGDMAEMRAVAQSVVPLAGEAKRRAEAAESGLAAGPAPIEEAILRDEFAGLLAVAV
ncbi:beta-N-acetylhexosaminidase [Consotaella aegiceratis]|uniref:beta-N-acetylhexosaminidase n=1 Tax=Consotaella aegiceratis TaxID=3097961 RepID=UPI002F42411F